MSPTIHFPTKAAAESYIGGLSKTSKMPGPSWSISARECSTGGALRNVSGSVCSKCYALKGAYNWPGTVNALDRRLTILRAAMESDTARANFIGAFIVALRGVSHFRWFDSGDLQSVEHFALIAEIAAATPDTAHWMPTKEPRFVKRYNGEIPANLVVRVSAPMIDGPSPRGFANTSTVHNAAPALPGAHVCPAPANGGKCGTCRACWTSSVVNVSYRAH